VNKPQDTAHPQKRLSGSLIYLRTKLTAQVSNFPSVNYISLPQCFCDSIFVMNRNKVSRLTQWIILGVQNNSLENLYTFLVSVICRAYFISLILLVLITLTILGHIQVCSNGNTSDVYSVGFPFESQLLPRHAQLSVLLVYIMKCTLCPVRKTNINIV
jgi:hypothetical protein